MSSTLERIETLEKTVADLNQRVTLILSMLGEVQSHSQQVMSTEQGVISLGKTLTAVLKTLVAKNMITSAEVMDQIIKIDAENDKEELENIKATGQVGPTDKVDNECAVVVAQNYINVTEPEKCRTISDFIMIRMWLPSLPEQLRADFQGRKVGDTLTTSKKSETEYYAFTVKEIYKIKVESQGGPEAAVTPGPVGTWCDDASQCDGKCENCCHGDSK